MKVFGLKLVVTLLFLFVCFIGQTNAVQAQVVFGVVADAQKSVIPRAKVVLKSNDVLIFETQTDASGKFSITTTFEKNLVLQVEANGFAIFEKKLINNFDQPLEIILSPQNPSANVTVSITRTESVLSETPASVIVLNRAVLNVTAAQTLDDALRQVPGLTLFRRTSSRTANPTAQGTNLRGVGGSGTSRAAVLFDGVSLNDAFGGWTYWSRVPRIAVEQIEVLRGGASDLYGTGALSGVVNVLTKTAEEDKLILRAETFAGTQKTISGSLFTAAARKGWAASLAFESFQTAGYVPVSNDARSAVDTPANSRHTTILLGLERKLSENARVFARGNSFTERRDNGTSLQKNRTFYRQAIAGGDFNSVKLGSFAARSFLETQVYDQTFSAVSLDRNNESLSRLQRVPSQAFGANLLWSRSFADAHTISSLFETRQVRGFSDETIFNAGRAASIVGTGGKQNDYAVFVGDFWRVNQKLNLNFAARFDFWRNENALSSTTNLILDNQTTTNAFSARSQSALSPRIAATYQATNKLSFVASFARSFRAPTLNELYRAFRVGNVLTLANENLTAERANTFEVGARRAFLNNKINLRSSVFWTQISDPVVNVTLIPTPNLIVRQRQNLGQTRSRGLEVDFETKVRQNWQITAGYLLVDAEVQNFPGNENLAGKQLPQVARHQFTFNTFYRFKSLLALGLQGRASSAQFDDDQNNFQLRPFFTLDAFGSFRLAKNLEIFAAAENVFNNRYDIALTPTRNVAAPALVRIGLRFNLIK